MTLDELSVFDLVRYKESKSPFYIIGISYMKGILPSSGGDYVPFEDIEPIPFSTDFFEANGFECNDKHAHLYDADGEGGWIDIEYLDSLEIKCVDGDMLIPCKYINDFQHALRLCGLKTLANNLVLD